MTYTNTPVITSTTGVWSNTNGISFSTVNTIPNIPYTAQLEVERIFNTDRDGSTAEVTNFLTDIDVKQSDKRDVFLIPNNRLTTNNNTKTITAIDLPSAGNVYNFTYYKISDPNTPHIIKVPALLNNDNLIIRRKTVSNIPLVTWVPGSKLTSSQLNLQTTQLLYLVQELFDRVFVITDTNYNLTYNLANNTVNTAQITDGAVTPNKLASNGSWSFTGTVSVPAPTANAHATTRLYSLNRLFEHGVMTKDDSAPSSSAIDILETASTAGASGLWFDPKTGQLKVWAGNAWVAIAGTPVTTANLVSINTAQTLTAAKTFTQNTTITSTTPSTATNNGALIVSGGVGIGGAANIGGNVNMLSTGYVKIPSGTTGQRPSTPAAGMIRYSTTSNRLELYNGTAWESGLGVAPENILTITNTTASTATNNGALIVSGGVGIGGAVNVFSDSKFNGVRVGRGAAAIVFNTAVGSTALDDANATGANQTAVGVNALSNASTGNSNTAVGLNALRDNQQGELNTAMGVNAMYSNTTGNYNIALGVNAMYYNTEGSNNSAMGVNSLVNNTGGSDNSVVGGAAMYSNTTGDDNSVVGRNAMYSNTTGASNSAVGVSALGSNVTGDYNSAVGSNALGGNGSGSYNAAVGSSALISNTTGSNNTALGVSAMYSNTTGSSNVAVGLSAGRYHSDGSTVLTDPENSIYIGVNAKGLNNADNNTIVIGANAVADGANTTVIGTSSTTSTRVFGTLSTNGIISTTASTPSTATNNGALIVSGGVGIGGAANIGGNVNMLSTGYVKIPSGTTADRPGLPATGMLRYNTTINQLELYSGTAWESGLGVDPENILTITNTTVSTSAGTGALIVSGGVGIGGAVNVSGVVNVGSNLSVQGGNITTTSTGTAAVFNTSAQTVNIAGSATAITLGNPVAAVTTIRGGTIVGNTSTQNLFNSTTTTLNLGGAATTVSIGNISGTTTINSNLALGAGRELRLTDSNTLYYNAFRPSGPLTSNKIYNLPTTIGSVGQVLTIQSVVEDNATLQWTTTSPQTGDFLTLTGNLVVNGGNIQSSAPTFNLLNNTVTTLNLCMDATNITMGHSTTATTTIRGGTLVGNRPIQHLFNTTATTLNLGGEATAINMGSSSNATTTIRGGTLVGNTATQNLFNTTALTLNIGHAATVVSIGSDSGTTTIRGNISTTVGTPSSSTTTGAVKVTGGIGVTGAAYIGGSLNATASIASTHHTTGALLVPNGGVGVSGAVNAGSDSKFNGVLVGRGLGNRVDNTVLGKDALIANTTGISNTAIGYSALWQNTTGSNNTAMGSFALFTNITGANSTAVGAYALYKQEDGQFNTAVGNGALRNNITGDFNTALGYSALYNSLNNSNTAVGFQAMLSTTTGEKNTAIGVFAMQNGTTGVKNAALGYYALGKNTTGGYNTAVGHATLYENTTGTLNVAIGHEAGRYHADGLTALTDPDSSVYIGAGAKGFNNDDNNTIVIGAGAVSNGANTTVIGNSSTTSTQVFGTLSTNGIISTTADTASLSTGTGALVVKGGVGIGGAIYLGDNVVMASGNGISFSATTGAAGMTSKLLNDYEEGTWTPTYVPQTGSFAALTMEVVCASYTKVGRMVMLNASIRTDNLDATGASGQVRISGIPFAIATLPGQRAVGSVSLADAWAGDTPLTVIASSGTSTTQLLLGYRTSINGADSIVDVSDMTTGATQNRNEIAFTICYHTAT